MFDIGFWELAIIGVVALLVIGPERLPSVARTVGQWVGKTKQFVSYVQSDIKQELGKADELKKLLAEQAQIKEVHEIIEQTVSETKKVVAVGTNLSNHAVKSFDETETLPPQSRSVASSESVPASASVAVENSRVPVAAVSSSISEVSPESGAPDVKKTPIKDSDKNV